MGQNGFSAVGSLFLDKLLVYCIVINGTFSQTQSGHPLCYAPLG